MSDEKKATPRPWKLVIDTDRWFDCKTGVELGPDIKYWIKSEELNTIVLVCGYQAPDEANAALIVKAVNAYDDLVAALELAQIAIASGYSPQQDAGQEKYSAARVAVTAALAKAKAGK